MWKRKSKSKGCKWPENCQVTVFILVLILLVFLLLSQSESKKGISSTVLSSDQSWKRFESLVKLHPTRELRNGTEVIWQVPESPKAVLFIAHGCDCKAGNFWDKTPNCQECIGLPEDRLIVIHALARNYAVLTISSSGRCWKLGKELLSVKDVIRWWVVKNKLENLPLMALGASSGGYFVSVLATVLKFSSITLMISEGMFDTMDINEDYPPTLFVHMPKDQYRRVKIDKYMAALRKKGVDVEEIKCMEVPLSTLFLSDRIPGLDPNVSSKLFEKFGEKGFIDANGFMQRDGRATGWAEALLLESEFLVPYMHLKRHIQEELNVAFAYHEMTSLHSDDMFRWFESHLS